MAVGMRGRMDQGRCDILDIDKVTGLKAIPMNRKGDACRGSLKKFGNSGGVRTLGILSWTVDVEKAKCDGGKGG